ncbi:MAG: isoleucine--tRNA ligase [Verrucomicrobiales bacterium]|nr:isoleucine--tRNA ligase [Verrucomicrobiales bacterium]
MNYKDTLNLPQTGFPMKAGLVQREPERLKQWYAENIHDRIRKRHAQATESFVLHDGPPFANGDVHIGTALNKTLKDFILKFQTMRGKNVPYVPGWDCHGLPIEFKVMQDLRKENRQDATAADIRKACETYARKYIDIQREQFKRLGVFGDWDNPYLTLDKKYEAEELRLFADIVEKGFVYRGKKPVYWSIPCRTALAEAEVEYADHVSQSVFVKFPVSGEDNTHLIIWTTTPWTLPANLAVAYNSRFTYKKVRVNGELYILESTLLPTVAKTCGWENIEEMQSLKGDEIGALEYRHPFIDKTAKLFAGDNFVENTTGTGFVHVAPGHGMDDYHLGCANGLPIYCPVNDDGKFAHTDDLPVADQMPADLLGKSILEKKGKSEANEAVLELLREKSALVHQENYTHSYPHCWRSKTPVIFRGMDQWFINIDHEGFRQTALAAIDEVNWVPDWGKARIQGAVESRPDWCISRQRTWGVPIPAFYNANGEPLLDARIVRKTANLIEQHGSNIWFERDTDKLWADVRPDDWTGDAPTKKSTDTLDVWIDSGSSSRAVLMQREELQRPDKEGNENWQADVYLEGSDQHRGWFQSSLLLSLAGNGAPPYKTVLTHGFMVDADRAKIAKSNQGSNTKPQTSEAYIGEYGADIVRLWIASQDFRNDITVSNERIKKVAETYRNLRNALRYQLSNLYDFDPAQHTLSDADLTSLDRWMLDQFTAVVRDVTEAYERFEYHVVYQRISQFVSVELSAIYHDCIKDRLYAEVTNAPSRRAAQTTLHRLATGLTRMLAPICVFTAEESWGFLPGTPTEKADSIHLADWPEENFELPAEEKSVWQNLFAHREPALAELEKARQEKLIGKALEARVTIRAADLATAQAHAETLRELINISQLELVEDKSTATPSYTVTKAHGEKCTRCWRWETSVGEHKEHLEICERCVEAVA